MYAAVRRYEGITDDSKAGHMVGESFVPLLEQIPGFVAYYWIDAGDGTMASLSVYEHKEGADRSVEIAHEWVATTAPHLFTKPPQVTEGHVVASDTAAAMRDRASAPA